jgi:hypothetical protein
MVDSPEGGIDNEMRRPWTRSNPTVRPPILLRLLRTKYSGNNTQKHARDAYTTHDIRPPSPCIPLRLTSRVLVFRYWCTPTYTRDARDDGTPNDEFRGAPSPLLHQFPLSNSFQGHWNRGERSHYLIATRYVNDAGAMSPD